MALNPVPDPTVLNGLLGAFLRLADASGTTIVVGRYLGYRANVAALGQLTTYTLIFDGFSPLQLVNNIQFEVLGSAP